MSPRFSRLPNGFAWFRTPMAAGARPAVPTTIRTSAALGRAHLRRLHGLYLDYWPPEILVRIQWQREFGGWLSSNMRMEVGASWCRDAMARAITRALVFRESSTLGITYISSTSRCWR